MPSRQLHSVARLRDRRQDEKELRPVIGTAICLRSRANSQSGYEAALDQDDAETEMKPHSEILWDP